MNKLKERFEKNQDDVNQKWIKTKEYLWSRKIQILYIISFVAVSALGVAALIEDRSNGTPNYYLMAMIASVLFFIATSFVMYIRFFNARVERKNMEQEMTSSFDEIKKQIIFLEYSSKGSKLPFKRYYEDRMNELKKIENIELTTEVRALEKDLEDVNELSEKVNNKSK